MSIEVAVELSDENFLRANGELLRTVQKQTHFTKQEVDALAIIYSKFLNEFDVKREQMDRNQFRAFLNSTFQIIDDFLIERAFLYLDKGTTPSPFITLATFIKALSLFLRGTLDEKMEYCFFVYDLSNDGKIKRNDIIKLTRKYFISDKDEDCEVMVKDFSDILVRKIDVDCDGEISYDDFSTSVKNQPELLECFGHCLPNLMNALEFMKTFTHDLPA